MSAAKPVSSIYPANISAARLQSLHLRELWNYVAEQRFAAGLPLYDNPAGMNTEVAESAGVDISESASLSDFPNMLGNNLYRRVQDWWESYAPEWLKYAYVQEHSDYRPVVYGFISELEDAKALRQEQDYLDSQILDKGYSLSLQKYGRLVTLPYIVIENDDKGIVAQLPDKMMKSMDRLVQKIVVRNTLEANPNAYDGNALFGNTRGTSLANGANLVGGGGSTFNSTNLQQAVQVLQTSVGDSDLNPSGAPLNVQPKYLLAPTAIEMPVFQTLHSTLIVAAGTAGTVTQLGDRNPLTDKNPYYMPVVPIIERYLTSTTAWYLLPDPAYSPITVALRQGRRLKPRVWVNIPMRRQMLGGDSEPYQLSVDDQVFGWSLNTLSLSIDQSGSEISGLLAA